MNKFGFKKKINWIKNLNFLQPSKKYIKFLNKKNSNQPITSKPIRILVGLTTKFEATAAPVISCLCRLRVETRMR